MTNCFVCVALHEQIVYFNTKVHKIKNNNNRIRIFFVFRILVSIIISSQSLNLDGRRGSTDDVAAILFHHSLSSATIRKSPNSIPVHTLMLYSHLVFCRPLLLAPFAVPCRIAFAIIFAMPGDLEMWLYHLKDIYDYGGKSP